MTESPAVYLEDTAVKCPSCGRVVGHYQQVQQQVWLRVGCLSCREIRAVCECGAEFDYMVSGKRLERLIERIKKDPIG